jgi:four helix bundle protein
MHVMDVNDWAIQDKPYDLREEEADDGSSQKDARAKRQIVLRELKETSFRLRVLRQTGILTPAHDPVINECAELVEIVAVLIRKSKPT